MGVTIYYNGEKVLEYLYENRAKVVQKKSNARHLNLTILIIWAVSDRVAHFRSFEFSPPIYLVSPILRFIISDGSNTLSLNIEQTRTSVFEH